MEKRNQIKKILNQRFSKKSSNHDIHQQDSRQNSLHSDKQDIYANILATNNQVKQFLARKHFNRSIYNSYSEYIEFLEQFIEVLTDHREIEKITLELEKLRLEREKYYEPSLLEGCSYDLIKEVNEKYKDVKIINKNRK